MEVQIQLALSLGLLASDAKAQEVITAMAKNAPWRWLVKRLN
jgi:hypothetical protein